MNLVRLREFEFFYHAVLDGWMGNFLLCVLSIFEVGAIMRKKSEKNAGSVTLRTDCYVNARK